MVALAANVLILLGALAFPPLDDAVVRVRGKQVNDRLTLTVNRYGRQLQVPVQVDERQ